MAKKYESDLDELASGIREIHLPVTVLSWNINGKGIADCKQLMTDSVVSYIDPDVMLLQEPQKSTINRFSSLGEYDREQAGKEEQAQVLYKRNTFEKISTSTQNSIIDNILEEMFPANQPAYQTRSATAKQQIKERICVVHLRHKRTEREIIFISYHNILKGKGGELGICKTRASSVCQIIAKIHESSKCCVIAGVDFNCKNFDRTYVKVPDYKATPRREEISKVDFFILPKKSTEKWTVEAFDIFPQERRAPFYIELRSLLNYHVEGEYKKAFDHDPLTLSLKID